VTATLPAALLVIFWWQRGRLRWREDVLPLMPFFLLGAAAGALTAWVERKLIGAEGLAFELSFGERCLIAGRAIWFYLGKLVWPANLVFVYPRWSVDPTVWWQWLFPLSAVAVTAALWAVRKRWRAPLAGWLLFVGTLLPVLGFLNVYPFVFSFVADHFQYLAGLGVITLASAGLTLAVDRLPASARRAGQLASAAVVICLAALTMVQSSIYGNVEALYRRTIERNPLAWMPYNNLGAYYMDHDREDEAEPLLQLAIGLRSDYPEALMNLGVRFAHQGRPEAAIDLYQRAIAARAGYAEAENNWGNALAALAQPREAVEHYQRALRLRQSYYQACYNLANALRDLDDVPGAIARYEEAIGIKPDFAEAHYNLGLVFGKADRLPEAIAEFRAAVRLRPEMAVAHYNLGLALAASGDHEAAVDEYLDAVRGVEPCFAAYGDLARELARLGRSAEAISAAEEAQSAAEAAGGTEQAHEIGDWLAKYRASVGASQATPGGEGTPNAPAGKSGGE
jgi:tetratricopeptide (TPR) repeat protein